MDIKTDDALPYPVHCLSRNERCWGIHQLYQWNVGLMLQCLQVLHLQSNTQLHANHEEQVLQCLSALCRVAGNIKNFISCIYG